MSKDAQWIGGGKFPQAPLFRREFELPSTVASASVRICGLGYYELRLNGSKVGDHVLDPVWFKTQPTCNTLENQDLQAVAFVDQERLCPASVR